jgi:hypothetical protein
MVLSCKIIPKTHLNHPEAANDRMLIRNEDYNRLNLSLKHEDPGYPRRVDMNEKG